MNEAPGFAALYDEHVWSVYGFVAYRLGGRGEAEDLTQQTFERALRSWHRYDPARGGAEAWLITIARNVVIDHLRRSGRDRPTADDELESALGTTPALDADLGVDPDLAAALAVLSERERELIALRFGGDLTGPEIADVTGLTLDNVHQILSRALRRLRRELEARSRLGRD